MDLFHGILFLSLIVALLALLAQKLFQKTPATPAQSNEVLIAAREQLRASRDNEARLTAELQAQSQRLEELRKEAATLNARCATAETKSSLIPALEEKLRLGEEKFEALQKTKNLLEKEMAELQTAMEGERKAADEKLALLNEAQEKLSHAFKSLSAEALKSNNASFLQLAKENLERFQSTAKGDLELRQKAIDGLVKPLQESLAAVNKQINEVEKTRTEAYVSLTEQVKSLTQTHGQLQSETNKLVTALRRPATRGRWGEIQLQRVVEMAGMQQHCDFTTQLSVSTEEGHLRPDMVIHLPNNKNIVVDSKVSLDGYLNALETQDEDQKKQFMESHARQIRTHINQLSAKEYWRQFEPTPEFVVLFLPAESFFSAALEQDHLLLDDGIKQQVIIATPTTLIALLKAVAYGWRQEDLAANAQEISKLGSELYDRIRTLTEHFSRLNRGLKTASEAYNAAVGTLESRVLVSARRFKELKSATAEEIPLVEALDQPLRSIQAQELVALPEEEADDDGAEKTPDVDEISTSGADSESEKEV